MMKHASLPLLDDSKLRIGLTLFTGIGIGAVAMHGLHAQAKPPAYLISDVTVTDENGYKEYIEKFPATLVPFGGKFLVRAGQTVAVPRAREARKRPVVVVFDSLDKAKAWSDVGGHKGNQADPRSDRPGSSLSR